MFCAWKISSTILNNFRKQKQGGENEDKDTPCQASFPTDGYSTKYIYEI